MITDKQSRILLIHRNTAKLMHWELPGGKVEPGETAKAAAIRELHEELGVKVSKLTKLGDVTFDEDDKIYHYTWFTVGKMIGGPHAQETDKHDDCQYFSLDEMASLTLSNNTQLLLDFLKDAKAVANTSNS